MNHKVPVNLGSFQARSIPGKFLERPESLNVILIQDKLFSSAQNKYYFLGIQVSVLQQFKSIQCLGTRMMVRQCLVTSVKMGAMNPGGHVLQKICQNMHVCVCVFVVCWTACGCSCIQLGNAELVRRKRNAKTRVGMLIYRKQARELYRPFYSPWKSIRCMFSFCDTRIKL